jgi:hypothetical protein
LTERDECEDGFADQNGDERGEHGGFYGEWQGAEKVSWKVECAPSEVVQVRMVKQAGAKEARAGRQAWMKEERGAPSEECQASRQGEVEPWEAGRPMWEEAEWHDEGCRRLARRH